MMKSSQSPSLTTSEIQHTEGDYYKVSCKDILIVH